MNMQGTFKETFRRVVSVIPLVLLSVVAIAFLSQWAFLGWVRWTEPIIDPAVSLDWQELTSCLEHSAALFPGNRQEGSKSTFFREPTGDSNRVLITADNADRLEVISKFPMFETYVASVAFSPDSQLLASGVRGSARLWDVPTQREIITYDGVGDWPVKVAFSPDGQLLAISSKNAVEFWKIGTHNKMSELSTRKRMYHPIFSPNWRLLATEIDNGTLRVLDVGTGYAKFTIRIPDNLLYQASFSPDGCVIATGSSDGMIRIWDAATGREYRKIQTTNRSVTSVVFSPDGRLLATGSDSGVSLWYVTAGREVRSLRGDVNTVRDLVFSPDGKLLASVQGWTVTIWEIGSGRQLKILGHHKDATSVAFSPDGRYLASGSQDNILRLWGVR